MREADAAARTSLTLADYAAALASHVAAWPARRFVVVAHSIGGVLALRLAAEWTGRLAGIIAVGAAIPRAGGSFLSALPLPKRLLLRTILRTAGTKPPESAIRAGLCNDLPTDAANAVVRGFAAESLRLYTDPCGAAVPHVPKLYVKLTADREFGSALQDWMIANFAPDAVREMACGHLPMLAQPEELRGIVDDFAARLEGNE